MVFFIYTKTENVIIMFHIVCRDVRLCLMDFGWKICFFFFFFSFSCSMYHIVIYHICVEYMKCLFERTYNVSDSLGKPNNSVFSGAANYMVSGFDALPHRVYVYIVHRTVRTQHTTYMCCTSIMEKCWPSTFNMPVKCCSGW